MITNGEWAGIWI